MSDPGAGCMRMFIAILAGILLLAATGGALMQVSRAPGRDLAELAPVQEGLNEGEDHAVEGLLTGSPLNQEARKRVALGLAESLLKLKRPHLAALFFRLALRLENSKAQQEELSRRVEAVKTELARKAENARRRPVITENLEQDHPVRPRLED